MATKKKSPEVLDGMIEHVRYELVLVLRAFRDFLRQLRESTPRRYDLFVQPRKNLPVIELLPVLDAVLVGPAA